MKLGGLRKEFPTVPILTLSASIKDTDIKQTINILGIQGCKIFTNQLDRQCLFYVFKMKSEIPDINYDIVDFIQRYDGQVFTILITVFLYIMILTGKVIIKVELYIAILQVSALELWLFFTMKVYLLYLITIVSQRRRRILLISNGKQMNAL